MLQKKAFSYYSLQIRQVEFARKKSVNGILIRSVGRSF